MINFTLKKSNIVVIGLGYVGLPLAIEFSKKYNVLGYDQDEKRINFIKNQSKKLKKNEFIDITKAKNLKLTYNEKDLLNFNIFIICVPTPITKRNKPDLSMLESASALVARNLKKKDIVIYESTVFPGATEEFCVPILEKFSKLQFNRDFFCGYSPERINPGDQKRTLTNIKKITSGSNEKISEFVDKLYLSIIKAGTHKASSIKVAEAAKIIENTQRDLNIALINELSIIFNRLDISTREVLAAAKTKWNFLDFQPGLVGGHCIGVDPYYLTHRSKEAGYKPKVILAGREMNDGMGKFIANQVIKLMAKKKIRIPNAKILILGLTFKENCADYRNTKVIDIVKELRDNQTKVEVYDPWIDKNEVRKILDVDLVTKLPNKKQYSAIILAVAHDKFKNLNSKVRKLCKPRSIIYDIKNILSNSIVDKRL